MITPETIRSAALAVDGVLGMHPGPFGTAATFTADGRIWGVRATDSRIDVHVVAEEGTDLARVGRDVQASVTRACGGYAGLISVHIEDITLPATPGAEPTGSGASPVAHTGQPRRTP